MLSQERKPKDVELQRNLHKRAKQLRVDQTKAEKILWHYLRSKKLCGYKFRRQWPIGHYIIDFYCSAAGLIIEIDGKIHEQRMEYDCERDSFLHSKGFTVIRFSNEEVYNNLEVVLRKIQSHLS